MSDPQKTCASKATPSPAPHRGPLAALGFGAYLGTSWTWVIGMLFPALILRDYGLWGFVAFAIPNVVGAAAMGWVLTPQRARWILERHKTACAWFSVVTMAFHLFVVAWLLPALFGNWAVGVVLLSIAVCLLAHKFRGVKGLWLASGLVWILSMVMFAKGSQTDGAWAGASWEIGQLGKPGLLAFIPASVLGFALCPYLDLTFLKARAETEKNTGRAAFGIGFGMVFCAMIFFTVCYGGQLWGFFAEHSHAQLPSQWRWILMAHLPVQIGLTLAWHGLEIAPRQTKNSRYGPLTFVGRAGMDWAGLIFVFAILIGLFAGKGFGIGEPLYRSFLLLYGTALPAYVLLKIIPSRAHAPGRVRTIAFVGASLLSYPLAWGVFVLNHHWMIIPCASVLTLAFLAVQCWPKTICASNASGTPPGCA